MKVPWHLLAAGLFAALAFGSGCSKESQLQTHLKSADGYFEKREFEPAKLEYYRALRIQRTNTHAILNLSKIFFEQGDLRQAFPLLINAREHYPDDLKIRESLAIIYAGIGTNLWRGEVDAILQRDPTNEIGVLTLLRMSTTPAELDGAVKTVAALRQRAGDRAVFHIADAELAQRRNDSQAAEKALREAIAVEPGSVSAHLALGNLLTVQGKNEEATPFLVKAADLSPPYGPARLRLARFYLSNGKNDDAIKVLDEMNAKAPEVLAAFTARAEIAFGLRDFDRAMTLVDRVLSQSTADIAAMRLKSQILLSKEKPAEAVKLLERIVASQPRSSEAHYQLGVAQVLNNEIAQAVASLQEAAKLDTNATSAIMFLAELEIRRGNAAEAVASLSDLTRRFPKLAQGWYLLARAYLAASRLDDALNIYSALRRQAPTNPLPALQVGLVLRQKKQDAEARKAFEDCVRLDPNYRPAIEQLVGLDVEAKDFSSALRRVQQQVDADPKYAPAWALKGGVLQAQGKLDEAEAAFKQALTLDPESHRTLEALGRLYLTAGKRTEALAELKRAIDKEPRKVGPYFLIGMIQSEAGKLDEAQAAYEQALKLRPENPLLLNNLAYLLGEKRNQVDAAYGYAVRARRAEPKSSGIADTLGWLEYRRGNYSEALRLLTEASEDLSQLPEVQYHLGMAHYMMGHEGPARLALEQAVKVTADYPGKATAQEYLAMLTTGTGAVDPASIQALEKRRREAPGDPVALNRLAAAYNATGAYDKAREAYEAALKVSPKSVEALTQLALLHAQRLNNPAKALDLARQARQAAPPNDPAVAHSIGRVAYLAGDQTLAYSYLQESARRLTNNLQVTHDLAWAAYGIGRAEEAAKLMLPVAQSGDATLAASARDFADLTAIAANPAAAKPDAVGRIDQVLKADPFNPAALYAAGRLAEQQGRYEDARQAYDRLLGRFPAFMPATRQLALVYADHLGDDAKAYDLAVKARNALPRDEEVAAALGKLATRRGDHRYAVQLLSDLSRSRAQDAELHYYLGVSYNGLRQTNQSRASLEKAISLSPEAKFVPEAKKLLAAMPGPGG